MPISYLPVSHALSRLPAVQLAQQQGDVLHQAYLTAQAAGFGGTLTQFVSALERAAPAMRVTVLELAQQILDSGELPEGFGDPPATATPSKPKAAAPAKAPAKPPAPATPPAKPATNALPPPPPPAPPPTAQELRLQALQARSGPGGYAESERLRAQAIIRESHDRTAAVLARMPPEARAETLSQIEQHQEQPRRYEELRRRQGR